MKHLRTHIIRIAMAASLTLLLFVASCSLYRNDRTWIPEKKYQVAKDLYDQTGSIALTEQALRESHNWREAEIHEVLYRLKKELNLGD